MTNDVFGGGSAFGGLFDFIGQLFGPAVPAGQETLSWNHDGTLNTSPVYHPASGLDRLASSAVATAATPAVSTGPVERAVQSERGPRVKSSDTPFVWTDRASPVRSPLGEPSPGPVKRVINELTGANVSEGKFVRDKRIPLSIQTNNPGAMWPGPSSKKFGSVGHYDIPDKQKNKIAIFKTPEDGAAAHFDLLSRKYTGKTLQSAITEWSGGNYSAKYAKTVSAATGIGINDVLTADVFKGERGLKFAKAMSGHEAGVKFPLDEAGWRRAQARAFGESVIERPAEIAIEPIKNPDDPSLVKTMRVDPRTGEITE